MALKAGDPAPDFTLTDDAGASVSLRDFSDKKLVVYFYPKAFTPGCTTESCDFRDNHHAFSEAGYEIVGVSPDPVDKLARFRAEYDLPFRLLSDPNHEAAVAYGAWGVKKNYGREYEGLIRSTFVIEDGTVVEAMHNVRAKGHVNRLVKAIE